MVDQNNPQDKISRTLPGTDESKTQASSEAQTPAASEAQTPKVASHDSPEEDKQEEVAAQPDGSRADPRLTNLAIADPDKADLKELFVETCKAWNLKKPEKMLLESALDKGNFKKTADLVCAQLRSNNEYEKARVIDDHISLFEPHRFWDDQPVPKATDQLKLDESEFNKPIEVKTLSEVQQEPYTLPAEYNWCDLDLSNESVLDEVYQLLVENYVEDDEAMFRFDYSRPFLRWALLMPGGEPNWIVGVRGGKAQKLFGMITGIPVRMSLNNTEVMCAEINFLCVHKGLRAKRLAPILIKEITRRVNLKEMWQAIYTAGARIPTPITGATYWHRSLNPKKLLDVKFSHKSKKVSMASHIKRHALPANSVWPSLRPMQEEDIPQVTELLTSYLSERKIHIHFTVEEVKHFFMPQHNVVYTYVEGPVGGKLTDMFSFYCLPSQVLNHPQHNMLWVAYSYYNVSTTGRLEQGMEEILIRAKELEFDVFNCLDVMDNEPFLEKLKFGMGDGELHYYLYNWRMRDVTPKDLGIVLV